MTSKQAEKLKSHEMGRMNEEWRMIKDEGWWFHTVEGFGDWQTK